MLKTNIIDTLTHYREGILSEYIVASELEEYLSHSDYRSSVSVLEHDQFFVYVQPVKTKLGYKIDYLVSDYLLKNTLFDVKDIVVMIDTAEAASTEIVINFGKELDKLAEVDVTKRDMIVFYMAAFKTLLDKFPTYIKTKIKETGAVNLSKFEEYFSELVSGDNTESTADIIGNLKLYHYLPARLIGQIGAGSFTDEEDIPTSGHDSTDKHGNIVLPKKFSDSYKISNGQHSLKFLDPNNNKKGNEGNVLNTKSFDHDYKPNSSY